MNLSLRYYTALTSLLVMLGLLGHSAYHALDRKHHHHTAPHGHAHSHSHSHEEQPDKNPTLKAWYGVKCDLFSFVTVLPQNDLVIARRPSKVVFSEGITRIEHSASLVPRSRAPPVMVTS